MKRRKDGLLEKKVKTGTGYKSVYGHSLQEAKDREYEIEKEIEAGIVSGDTLFKDFAEQWLDIYKANKSERTQEYYTQILRPHIIPVIGDMPLKKLTPMLLQRIINDHLKTPRAALDIRMTLNQICRAAMANRLLATNPAEFLSAPPRKKTEKDIYSVEEIQAFHTAAFNFMERAFVFALLYAGLRRGETLALTWDDINGGLLSISKSCANGLLKEPKTASGIRQIPISPVLAGALDSWKSEQSREHPGYSPQKAKLVFPQNAPPYRPMTFAKFRTFWSGIERKLEFPINCHKFRHTFASTLWDMETDMKTMQLLLGHADTSVLMNTYTHIRKQQAINKVRPVIDSLYGGAAAGAPTGLLKLDTRKNS
jgi:integrase